MEGKFMTLKLRFTSEEISDGKKNLKQVLIDGRETATGFGEYIDFLTPVIAPQHPNAEIKNLRSLVFHRNDDGWFAVFVLKKVQNGLPDVFGTPSDRPCKNFDEVYDQACITVGLLYNARKLGIKPRGGAIKIPSDIREKLIFTAY
tara:strand:- start:21687 stop:22124 length:438 start_codon:yes stop_codon:yes gene_type:complete